MFAFTRVALGYDLDTWSRLAIAGSLTALAAWSVFRRTDPIPTALAAIGLVLAFYKHGSIGYPIMLAVPAAWFATEVACWTMQRVLVLYAGWDSTLYLVKLRRPCTGVRRSKWANKRVAKNRRFLV